MSRTMENEIMKALVVRDIELLRIIYFDANKGNICIKADLFKMLGEFIKNNSL